MAARYVPQDLRPGASAPRTFRSSNFARIYRQLGSISVDVAMKGLNDVVDAPMCRNVQEVQTWERLGHLAQNEDELTSEQKHELKSHIIAQWTGVGGRGRQEQKSRPLFQLMNRALINDDYNEMLKWCPFIRVLNKTLRGEPPDRDMVTFRGTKLTFAKARELYQPGQIVRACMYLATSLSRRVAEVFSEHHVKAEFHVPCGCQNAGLVYKLSRLTDEREILFPPYTALQVQSLDVETDDEAVQWLTIKLKVLDNLVVGCYEREPSHAHILGITGVPVAHKGKVLANVM